MKMNGDFFLGNPIDRPGHSAHTSKEHDFDFIFKEIEKIKNSPKLHRKL